MSSIEPRDLGAAMRGDELGFRDAQLAARSRDRMPP